jgi:MurNAc alpha-1-phosphate uridylyltransferase
MVVESSAFPFLSDTAMILAAGFGVRMRPLTTTTPKPLLTINGQTMLDLAINKLRDFGIRRIVVNGHYLADQIEAHIAKRSDIETIFSREETILDTGGGVKKALPFFGGKPFFVLGGDMPVLDGKETALDQMACAWDPTKMDGLMLLYPTAKANGFDRTKGDFAMKSDGQIWRKETPLPRPYVWISTMILHPSVYDEGLPEAFSNNLIFDRLEEAGRFYGIEHTGSCFHVGTPEDLAEANRLLQTGKGWG